MEVEDVLFDIADALRVPVLILALIALALVLFELGGLVAELIRRRGRGVEKLNLAIITAQSALQSGDSGRAYLELGKVAASKSMRAVIASIVEHRLSPSGSDRVAKDLAEFDYASIRRLERTRILVRVGPALGLMGTLIPLSPALAGLAEGDIQTLSDNLRVAFSVTVLGLLIGGVAFAISLVRDRLYGQDFSDLEYVAAAMTPGAAPVSSPRSAAPAQATPPATPAPTTRPVAPAAPAAPVSPSAPTQVVQPAPQAPQAPQAPKPPATPGQS